jgi:hypothetical protein
MDLHPNPDPLVSSQRYGSEDPHLHPDLYKNVTDPKHCFSHRFVFFFYCFKAKQSNNVCYVMVQYRKVPVDVNSDLPESQIFVSLAIDLYLDSFFLPMTFLELKLSRRCRKIT